MNFTDHDYEPKGQEFGCILFEDLPLVSNTQDSTDIDFINVLDGELTRRGCLLLTLYNTLHITLVQI